MKVGRAQTTYDEIGEISMDQGTYNQCDPSVHNFEWDTIQAVGNLQFKLEVTGQAIY